MENGPVENAFPIAHGDNPLLCWFTRGYMITPKIKFLGCRFISKNLEGFVNKFLLQNLFLLPFFSAQPDFFCEVLAGRTNHSSTLDLETMMEDDWPKKFFEKTLKKRMVV